MTLENTEFWWIPSSKAFPKRLIDELDKLPRKAEVTLRFVDFDGTLMDDEARFRLDPELRNHRKHAAVPYIKKHYPDDDWWEEFDNFLTKLDPKSHIFSNADDVLDPNNPHHFILTAWPLQFQKNKIHRAGYHLGERMILQFSATRKPINILRTCLKLGYIPGKIEFIDDRIENFNGFDERLSNILGIPVEFYRAAQDLERWVVNVTKVTQEKVNQLMSQSED